MLLAALVLSLMVQDPDPPIDCADAQTTLDMNFCAGEEVEAEEQRMRTYLAAAIDVLRDETETSEQTTAWVEELSASQKAWEAYAEGACQAVYTRWQTGTIRTAMALTCKKKLTEERSVFLWREYLTYMDSTPPILPEPRPLNGTTPVNAGD